MGRTACTEPQYLYSRAMPLLPLWAVRPVQSPSACTVELYLYSPCGPHGLYRASVPVQGCTLLLLRVFELVIDTAVYIPSTVQVGEVLYLQCPSVRSRPHDALMPAFESSKRTDVSETTSRKTKLLRNKCVSASDRYI
jgi:hypothetical protein